MDGLSAVIEELADGQWDATVFAGVMTVAGSGPFPSRNAAESWAFKVMVEVAPEPVPAFDSLDDARMDVH